MIFHFRSSGSSSGSDNVHPLLINMAYEVTFDNGKRVQVLYAMVNGRRSMVYRESDTGKWLDASGISLNGISRTPENVSRAVVSGSPKSERYVMPMP